MRLARCTSAEVGAVAADVVVVLPIGSLEQHSHHLPLGTDAMLAEAVCDRLEQALPSEVLLAPTLWFGASDHHLGFPGSVSIGSELVAEVVAGALSSLFRSSGLSRFLIVNGHGGNEPGMRVAVEKLGRLEGVLAWGCNYWDALLAALAERGTPADAGMGHACHLETSLVLGLDSELVRTDRLEADPVAPHEAWLFDSRGFRQTTQHGGKGDPRQADAAFGAHVLELAADRLATVVRRLAGTAVS